MYQLTTMGTYLLEDVSDYMRTSGKDVPVDREPMQREDVSISTKDQPNYKTYITTNVTNKSSSNIEPAKDKNS